jgi:phosphoserine phosphatase
VIFDLDGVLVDIDSSWRLVHRAFGVDNEVNYRRYLAGEIDFKEFMRTDINLWGKQPIKKIEEILDTVPIMSGAAEVVNTVKDSGMKPVILSSGISILANRVARELGIGVVYANRLVVDEEGWLTGEGEEVVPLKDKHKVLREVVLREGVVLRHCIVVGDSRFDVSAFKGVGLSVAFNPRDEKVRMAADVIIEGKDLRSLIPWIINFPPHRATIRIELDRMMAKAIVAALSPDNIKVPEGISIKTYRRGGRALVKLISVKGLESVLSTLDEILACSQLALSSIRIVSK